MSHRPRRLPSYRRHASGQATVRIDGRDYYLGEFNSASSKEAYRELLAKSITNGEGPAPETRVGDIAGMVERYLAFADGWYRHADGTPTSEARSIRQALRPLVEQFAELNPRDFGPLRLEQVCQRMITQEKWCRTHINRAVGRVKACFKWAKNKQLILPSVYEGIRDLPALKMGRSEARESDPVRPAPKAAIQAVLPHVSEQVAAMIQMQLLTGARPGEICSMRTADLRMEGKVWRFEPEYHKTQHHGHRRQIWLGPQAQEIVGRFLKADPKAFIFCPRDAEQSRNEERRDPKRRLTPSARRRRALQRSQGRAGAAYNVGSYRRAIARACDQAFPPPDALAQREGETAGQWKMRLSPKQWAEVAAWRRAHRFHPHQLRHNAATELRARFGIEAARVVLGHKSAGITEVYATEADQTRAAEVMGEVG